MFGAVYVGLVHPGVTWRHRRHDRGWFTIALRVAARLGVPGQDHGPCSSSTIVTGLPWLYPQPDIEGIFTPAPRTRSATRVRAVRFGVPRR